MAEGDKRFCTVDCEVRKFDSEEDELEYLVISNDTREKTIEQKAREAQILIEVEKKKAEKRKLANLKQNTNSSSTECAELHVRDKGRSTDVVAKKLKMKSGREVERAVKSVETIDKLTETGRKDDAELIRDTLNNTSASTAADLSSHIDELTEDEKQAIRDKKMSAYKVVSKYATKRTPKITDDISEEEKAELEHKQSCKETVEEYIAQSMGLIDIPEVPVEDRTDDLIAFFNSSVSTFTAAITNLMGNVPNFSEEQINKVSNIISNAEERINQLGLSIVTQSINRNDDKRDIVNNKTPKSPLQERAKRLKDDSESQLTYAMITGMFKSETRNYLESLTDYIGMMNTISDTETGADELINQLNFIKYSITQKISFAQKIIIGKR